MFSGTINKWLVLGAIAALAAIVVACGTDDETKLISNDGAGGVGAQPSQEPSDNDGEVSPPPVVPGDQGFGVVEEFAPIESVEILVLESFPEQYVVQIVSGLPSGCATFSRADVVRDGSTIFISVYNTVPAPDQLIACTAIYGYHDENVGLGSDFDRDTEYTVMVNDHPAGYFKAGVSGTIPVEGDPPVGDGSGFMVAPPPLEGLSIITVEDSQKIITYYAAVSWGLSNGCMKSLEPKLVQSGSMVFDISGVAWVPNGDVACTDDYRIDSAQVELGVVGEGLVTCALYTVNYGHETVEFQAIAPNVRCPAPDAPTPTPAPPTSGGGSIIADSQALELSLEAKGVEVEFGGPSEFTKLFGLTPGELKVNGQRVQIYEFAPGTSAEEASEGVSLSGSTIVNPDGSAMSVLWIAPPHFYLFGNAIILYVGNDAEIGALLGSVAGMFAGQKFETTGSDDADDSEFTTRLATIERVSIASTRSIPAQHMIGVTIMLSSGCEEFKSIDWSVEGREVHVEVLTQVPTAPTPCTLAIVYEDQSVNIGDKYETGVEYDVIVNGERQGTFIGG